MHHRSAHALAPCLVYIYTHTVCISVSLSLSLRNFLVSQLACMACAHDGLPPLIPAHSLLPSPRFMCAVPPGTLHVVAPAACARRRYLGWACVHVRREAGAQRQVQLGASAHTGGPVPQADDDAAATRRTRTYAALYIVMTAASSALTHTHTHTLAHIGTYWHAHTCGRTRAPTATPTHTHTHTHTDLAPVLGKQQLQTPPHWRGRRRHGGGPRAGLRARAHDSGARQGRVT
jgi:hypothetical protein